MSELVIEIKIKEMAKSHNKSMSKDFPDRISEEVKIMVEKAIKRAEDNGRQTVMAKDV